MSDQVGNQNVGFLMMRLMCLEYDSFVLITTECNLPAVPQSGSYNISGDNIEVSFYCDSGFTLKGSSQITCKTDGSGYNAITPECGMLFPFLAYQITVIFLAIKQTPVTGIVPKAKKYVFFPIEAIKFPK